jgi:hypothetical protein
MVTKFSFHLYSPRELTLYRASCLYISCRRDICKISTFTNFQMFGWIKSKLFTCLIRGFSFYYIKQVDKILPLSVQLLIHSMTS